MICVTKTPDLRNRLRRLFDTEGLTVDFEPDLHHVAERFEQVAYDVLLITSVALKAGCVDGAELLDVILARSPATQVLFLAEPRDLDMAMASLSVGVYQYAKLPIGDDELSMLVQAALATRPAGVMPMPPVDPHGTAQLEQLIGRSEPMQAVYRQIRQAAGADLPVLLTGETGTGKDLAAQAIHNLSAFRDGPFVPVHLGAMPTELVTGELFGHERGAFTGALEKRPGRFEEARGGSIFLDEIGIVNEKVQVMLLRVLEQKSFRRLGGRRAVRTDARIIAATNENLEEAVAEGLFRQDVFYRLNVFQIVIPPLRERSGDIPLLIDHFIKLYNRQFQKHIAGIAPECIAHLEANELPGNVRELKNVIQRAVLVCPGEVILSEHLPPRFQVGRPSRAKVAFEVGTSLHEVEREMLVRTLVSTRNNRTRAAALLGISRRALYNKLRKHGL